MVQVLPPSLVRYMRKSVGLSPIDIATACLAPNASMSRNWRPAEFGGVTSCQVAPRFVVRMTLPSTEPSALTGYPLTQAVFELTPESPRQWFMAPVAVAFHA